MAKKVILDVLASTIGKYVKNLDAESLNVAVWSGQIELHSLDLDVQAVNAELDRQAVEAPNLALPFRVRGGGFASLEVQVPWARLSSRPVVVRAKGLRIVLEPVSENRSGGSHAKSSYSGHATGGGQDLSLPEGSTEQKRVNKMLEDRKTSIKLNDDYRRQANALKKLAQMDQQPGDDSVTTEAATQASFSSRLIRRVVENLQVEIESVHVAFKDHACAAGVNLQSLSLVTTDAYGNRTFVDRTVPTGPQQQKEGSFLYKALNITGFGIYLDENAPFGTIVEDGTSMLDNHTYILQPLSFEAKLRQSDSAKCIDFPKYLLSSQLSELSIALSRSQLEHSHRILAKSMVLPHDQPLFPEYRPLSRPHDADSSREWWHYAFKSVRRIQGKQQWIDFFLAFQQRKIYIQLYKRLAHADTCPWMIPLSSVEKAKLQELEFDIRLSMDGVMAWRNIADAQMELERAKHEQKSAKPTSTTSSYLYSFFGSAETKGPSGGSEDDPPITLTVEELHELEAMSREQSDEFELSKDSNLCDLSFVMKALRIDLRHGRPITELSMGTITASFNARADGSFKFQLAMGSLIVRDLVTPNTLFPAVMRNLSAQNRADSSNSHSLELSYGKTKTGDQDVSLSMVAFEMVASPLLLVEVKRFFSLDNTRRSFHKPTNPMLRESLSGSVDLFFDADAGQESVAVASPLIETEHSTSLTLTDQLSEALAEAWKAKTNEKSVWIIECDIEAPVLVLPEHCAHADSAVLVIDFGHVDLAYGGNNPASEEVSAWCEQQMVPRLGEVGFDAGKVFMDRLSLSVGRVSEVIGSASGGSVKNNLGTMSQIIEPVSAHFNCGVITVTGESFTRTCVFGELPSLCFRVSPERLISMLTVAGTWGQVASKLDPGSQDSEARDGGVVIAGEILPSSPVRDAYNLQGKNEDVDVTQGATSAGSGTIFHAVIDLKRLSLYLDRKAGDGLHAHLVSVSTSFSQMFDGSSHMRLRMGWFWILDMLYSTTPRVQRLLAHSTLPKTAQDISLTTDYEIFDHFADYLSSDGHTVSSDLADIRWSSPRRQGQIGQTAKMPQTFNDYENEGSLLSAEFMTLYVHWNPRAIKNLTAAAEDVFFSADKYRSRVEKLLSPRRGIQTEAKWDNVSVNTASNSSYISPFRVKANMSKFELILNSARDDLPLYSFTMSETSVTYISVGSDLKLKMQVGDLRIDTPLSSAKKEYHRLLGLAPNASSSLLSVLFYQGREAISSRPEGRTDANSGDFEACADIVISPMRFVYLQQQVMTLVEYVNDGILGALFARAASTAASAAMDIVASGSQGKKLFEVTGVGFDLVLPESPSSENYFVMNSADLLVAYTAHENLGGSDAIVSLGQVRLRDESLTSMVVSPLQMVVKAKLPPEGIGSLDDQAMRVNVNISSAGFLLSKEHYSQFFRTLDRNIGEKDTYLRQTSLDQTIVVAEDPTEGDDDERLSFVEILNTITHAGTAIEIKENRMYISLSVDSVSLEAFASGHDHAIVRTEALNMQVEMGFIPDEQKMIMKARLQNLSCEDVGSRSSENQFSHLFHRLSDETTESDIFDVTYTRDYKESKTSVEMSIGEPRLVFIPDTIAELMDFVTVDDSVAHQKDYGSDEEPKRGGQERVDVLEGSEGIEATYSAGVDEFSFALRATNCQVVMVDFGSSTASLSRRRFSVAEAIVVHGQFSCSFSALTEVKSGAKVKGNFEAHGEALQAFSAYGAFLTSPMQIMEPTSFSVFYHHRILHDMTSEMEFRCVTLSDVDMVLSMQNVALLEVIASGLTSAMERHSGISEGSTIAQASMSEQEAERITELLMALESDDISKVERGFSRESSAADERSTSSFSNEAQNSLSTSHWIIRMALPKVDITFVNDLQGLDEPLLRMGVANLVFGADVTNGMYLSNVEPIFDMHINCTLMADYFDSSVNLWTPLLQHPWEVTFKSSRGVSTRYRSNRLSSTFDLESFPCHFSFSEQFLASLNAASKMWLTYTDAIKSATENMGDKPFVTKRAVAASAARKLITSLPYGIENATGADIAFSLVGEEIACEKMTCPPRKVKFFRFEPPRRSGLGGRRLYGQEVVEPKKLQLYIEDKIIIIHHLDDELGRVQRIHKFDDGLVVITHVRKEAKSIILHVGSQIDLVNQTLIPFKILVSCRDDIKEIGLCEGSRASLQSDRLSLCGDAMIQDSSDFGLPVDFLKNFEEEVIKPVIFFVPQIPGLSNDTRGELVLPSGPEVIALVESETKELVVDTTCAVPRDQASSDRSLPDPFIVLVRLRLALLNNIHPYILVSMEPRAMLANSLPIPIMVKTPMPHTFSTSNSSPEIQSFETIHLLQPEEFIEVFTPGPSVAVSVKAACLPVFGLATDWMKGGWVDLPMMREFRLIEPIHCSLPAESFDNGESTEGDGAGSIHFFVTEDRDDLSEKAFYDLHTIMHGSLSYRAIADTQIEMSFNRSLNVMRSYLVTVCNYGIDHTGTMSFETVATSKTVDTSSRSLTITGASALSAFSWKDGTFLVSLLPSSRDLLRLTHQATRSGVPVVKRSYPFRIEDVSICEGGIESTPIRWEDGSENSYFMYRILAGSYQSEVHIIPEFVVYNGSKRHRFVVRQIGAEIMVIPGAMLAVHPHPKLGLVFTLDYLDFEGRAGPLRVDDLKHQIAMIKSIDSRPIASVAVQTVVGTRSSRLVIKVGEPTFGASLDRFNTGEFHSKLLERDMIRTRFRFSELRVTLNEATLVDQHRGRHATIFGDIVERIVKFQLKETEDRKVLQAQKPVLAAVLRQCTFDWQRIFKDDPTDARPTNQLLSPERSQLSLIVHNFQILDLIRESPFPVILDSTSSKISFADLCIRCRGPLNADLVKVDLFDLNLSHVNGISEPVVIRTSEDFVWKILDIVDRISKETTAISGVDMKLEWDDREGDYRVIASKVVASNFEYLPPPGDQLFDINKARVSPFTLLVTFKRHPEASRYSLLRDATGANLVNYFTTRLKFTLEKAELKFSRYEGRNIKGPPSRLIEILSTVYISRIKLKVVNILSATSFQDWKYLASRQDGDDEYVAGDLLRITGNLTGKSASFITKTVAHSLGGALSTVTRTVGDGIESASEQIGAGAFGAGVNNVVSGIGEGVSDTVKGVGTGAGKILSGAGKGAGHLFGGVAGGVILASKGIGEGVTKGDGRAVIAGFSEGALSVGQGVGEGVGSAVTGARDGVLAVGKGLFAGAKTVGKGFGSAFGGSPSKKPSKK